MKTFALAAAALVAFAETASALPPPPPATGPIPEIVVVARRPDAVTPRYQARLSANLDAMNARVAADLADDAFSANEVRLAAVFGDDDGDTLLARAGR